MSSGKGAAETFHHRPQRFMNTPISVIAATFIAAMFGAAPVFALSSDQQDPGALSSGVYQANLFDLPDGERPVPVKFAFHLLAIHEIDDEAETFSFTGMVTLVWKDTRQAFDPEIEEVDEKFFHGPYQFNELSPDWFPQLVLANATEVDDPQGVILRVARDGTNTLIQTITAEARSLLELRRYPFDRQRLKAVFTVLGFDESEVVLTAGEGAARGDLMNIQVPQWDVTGIDVSIGAAAAPHAAAGVQSSVLVLNLDVQRRPAFMIRLVIFPLMLIVLLSWSVFWMDRSSLGDRMAVSFVGILTAVAYQSMVSDIMPQISYMTLMNAILNFSFLAMSATVVVNLIVGAMDKRGESESGERLDLRCRWLFPLIYAGLVSSSALIAFVWF
jgi:hypothetical protein